MSDLLNELREKNNQAISRLTRKFYYIVFSMWFIGAFLIILNPEQLMSVGVLVIFFGFILLIITLFLSALNASKRRKNEIKNSVDLVYQNYMSFFNKRNATEYQFESNIEGHQEPWYLVPSFANKSIYYALKDDTNQTIMYHSEAYNVAGSNQTRSYYFQGLYIVIDQLGGYDDMQYRDEAPLHQKIISKLTPLIQEDEHRLSRFEFKKELESGHFYAQTDMPLPTLFQSLITLIKSKPYVSTVKLGIQNQQLHIAIEQKDRRLPYIKKYQEEELDQIEQIVKENATLLLEIEQVINNSQ